MNLLNYHPVSTPESRAKMADYLNIWKEYDALPNKSPALWEEYYRKSGPPGDFRPGVYREDTN